MSLRSVATGLPIAAAIGLAGLWFTPSASAQSLSCPRPHPEQGPGVLKETPTQIAEAGNFLVSGDSVNRASELAADLRKRYPGIGDAEIENYLVAAYCPVAARLNGLSLPERQARVARFARQASVAVYGH